MKKLFLLILITVSFSADFSYDTDSDIYGFQFRVVGAELTNAYGGAAEEAGFQISYNTTSGVIVAFSLSGNSIPAGQGTLINFDYTNGNQPCIEELILSGENGSDIVFDMDTCLSFVEVCHGIDGCNLGNILYLTDSDIYGFQFEITNAEIINIYDGASNEADFQISYNTSTGMVVAFSMQGDYIPAGNGTLLKIEYVGDPCINNLILSGNNGNNIESYISDCMSIVEGCENMDECGICNGNGYSCAICEELSEWGCNSNPYCDWLSETVSCSGLSSSQCNAADGCTWTSSGGGDYGGGGSSYCSGGTGEINGACFEALCENLIQNECEIDSECEWTEEMQFENCYGVAWNESNCEEFEGCEWSCSWIWDSTLWQDVWSCDCEGQYQADNGYCAEIEILGCMDPYAENYNPDANTNDDSCDYGALGTLSFQNYNYINNTLEVHMDCEFDVSNFEFTVEGLDITSFYGGTSENAEFNITLDGNTITGSSTTDNNIPSNSGLLMILNYESNDSQICFEESSITTYIGIVYEAVLDPCVVPGCTDLLGCNYNENATDSNGTCSYPYCDGSCDSGAELDECGVCNGEGIPDWACDCDNNILDCYGECGGATVIDECGICDGENIDCCPGDMNDDDAMDILDVIALVDALIELVWPSNEIYCSDFNNDQILDIIDIIIMVESILHGSPRYDLAEMSYANLINNNGQVSIDSDGYIAGIQIVLSHDNDFDIELTQDALISNYKTNGNTTNIIIAGLNSNQLFKTNHNFKIEHIIAGNSLGQINLEIPSEISISNAYPNPFNPSTSIDIHLPYDSFVDLSIYNIMGQRVQILHSGIMNSGTNKVIWNASNITSGIYFIKFESDNTIKTQKVLLVK